MSESELQPLDEDGVESVLCVVAHPDDIEYGTSAAVARWTDAGTRVSYYLLTRGEAGIEGMDPVQAAPARADEERASAAVVGVDRVDFADLRDGTIVYGIPLRRLVAAQIRRTRPDLVLTLNRHELFGPGRLNQADHRAVGLAVLDACADAGNRWIHPELAQDGLEPWHVKVLAFAASPEATHYVDVTGHAERAVASLEEHRLYNSALPQDFPGPREIVEMSLRGGAERVGDPEVTHALALEVYVR